MRVSDAIPQMLQDELLRLARLDRNWISWESTGELTYQAKLLYPTWLKITWLRGADAFAMWAMSLWLVDGPKIFQVTEEQCSALEQVEVKLILDDYTQPYSVLCVELPKGQYTPFTSVLCHKSERMLTCVLNTSDHTNDITTTVARVNGVIEDSLQKFNDDCKVDAPVAGKALRVACNACLALSHFGCHYDYLFPKEVESDRRLAREQSERGEKARNRIPLAPLKVDFDYEVKLHRTKMIEGNGEPTGKEHSRWSWRRGHWAMQPYGTGNSLRKRIFRQPVMVRADLFAGDTSQTITTYKG